MNAEFERGGEQKGHTIIPVLTGILEGNGVDFFKDNRTEESSTFVTVGNPDGSLQAYVSNDTKPGTGMEESTSVYWLDKHTRQLGELHAFTDSGKKVVFGILSTKIGDDVVQEWEKRGGANFSVEQRAKPLSGQDIASLAEDLKLTRPDSDMTFRAKMWHVQKPKSRY